MVEDPMAIFRFVHLLYARSQIKIRNGNFGLRNVKYRIDQINRFNLTVPLTRLVTCISSVDLKLILKFWNMVKNSSKENPPQKFMGQHAVTIIFEQIFPVSWQNNEITWMEKGVKITLNFVQLAANG